MVLAPKSQPSIFPFFYISYFPLHSFLSRAVKFSAKLMGQAMAKRVKATILYATETGKSQAYAKTLCEIFKHAFDAKVSRGKHQLPGPRGMYSWKGREWSQQRRTFENG